MNALNSLVKTIWIVMAALVMIGFLAADRFRLTDELSELRQEVAALQTQLAQEAEQCQASQTQLEQALAGEQAQRAQVESQVAGLQQQLTAHQQALIACRTDHAESPAANGNRPQVQAKEVVGVNSPEPAEWSDNTILLLLVALTATALAVLVLVFVWPTGHSAQPNLRALYLRRRSPTAGGRRQ